MKYIKEYNKEEFLKQWDISDTIKDCFIEYTDQYGDHDIEITYIHYKKNTYEYINFDTKISSDILIKLDNDFIERECGWRIQSNIKSDVLIKQEYNYENVYTDCKNFLHMSILFRKCCLKLMDMIPNYIRFVEGDNILIFPGKRK